MVLASKQKSSNFGQILVSQKTSNPKTQKELKFFCNIFGIPNKRVENDKGPIFHTLILIAVVKKAA